MQNLVIHILNPSWMVLKPPEPDARALGIFAPLAQAGGGSFKSGLGDTEVLVDAHPGHAYFAFRINGQAAAMAAMVWDTFPKGVWKTLVESHHTLMQNPKLNVLVEKAAPQIIPWLAISFDRDWAKAADDSKRRRLVTQLWAMSLAIHAHQKKMLASN
jgi:hypothetical protein